MKKKENKGEVQFLRQGKLLDKREGSVNSVPLLAPSRLLLSRSVALCHRLCFSLKKKKNTLLFQKIEIMDINLTSVTKYL